MPVIPPNKRLRGPGTWAGPVRSLQGVPWLSRGFVWHKYSRLAEGGGTAACEDLRARVFFGAWVSFGLGVLRCLGVLQAIWALGSRDS